MPGRLEPKPVPRRDFLGLAGWWTAGLAIAGSLIGMARLPKPRVTSEASRRFRLGKASEFPPGTIKVFSEYKVLVSSTERGFAAVSLVCTHLGCIVKETEEGFSCPCHGSKFDERGKVTGGPAPRGLPWFAITRAADGSLVVDTGKEVEAGTFYSA